MRMRGHRLARLFQHGYSHVTCNTRKVIKELIQGLSAFKVVK